MEDSQILELYFARDELAISETDSKYGQYCRTIAENILLDREDSEECVNDTWLRAWNAIPPQRPNLLRLFLGKITRNLSFDRYRADKAKKRGGAELTVALAELSECVGGGTDPADEAEMKLLKTVIGQFVDNLPQRERGIFLRRYFYVESTAEIAKQYTMKEANVRLILSRIRKSLREVLTKEGFVL